MTLDLFDVPFVTGFAARNDLITGPEEAELIAHIGSVSLSPFKFQKWTGKRLTCSFGWSLDFSSGAFNPVEPIPDWLIPLKVEAAAFAGLAPHDLVQALLIRYDPGAGIGWHRDRPVFEHVVGISLGNAATLGLRRRMPDGFERAKASLAPRSMYHLSGEARHLWEHSIAPMPVPRWSITFRSLSDRGRVG